MWHTADGMGWWMLWGAIMMILFWGLIVALIAWGIQSLTGQRRDAGNTQSATPPAPLDIAEQRYAAGEITGEQFDEITNRLRKA